MEAPKELSLSEIRKYMLDNSCKVTNHALVKHFKRFLTHPDTQNEARKEFKTYVNILATIKNENNQKYLILRKKYLHECPSDEMLLRAVSQAVGSDSVPSSPGGVSLTSEFAADSPYRQPPPYKPPPEVSSPSTNAAQTPIATGVAVHVDNVDSYRECVNELANAMARIDPKRLERQTSGNETQPATKQVADNKRNALEAETNRSKNNARENFVDEPAGNKENIPRCSFSSGSSGTSTDGSVEKSFVTDVETENPISVKEATRKFNRMASEEEAKIISPPSKKKPEKNFIQEKELPEVTLAHPKAKEWIVTMAKANYQELAKLANEYPELVKLHDPSTTALHWAAKHGNEDVVKLIAGTYKADVNAQTNAGYTPLHIAMQFGKANIFALLCNTYRANRDILDWAGNKPLDYSKQQTSVSASTYSKIKAKRKPTAEKDSGFLRIGSLNVRVKKTTEAFSNFLGVGNGTGNTIHSQHYHQPRSVLTANQSHQRHHRHHHYPHHHHGANGMMRNQQHLHPMMMKKSATMTMRNPPSPTKLLAPGSRASAPINTTKYDMLHKSWGSVGNITQNSTNNTQKLQNYNNKDDVEDEDAENALMPPPKSFENVKKRQNNPQRSSRSSIATDSPRDSISSTSSSNLNSGYSSMPTTPNQLRSPLGLGVPGILTADSDSDSACGFDSNWSINGRTSLSSSNLKSEKY